MRKFYLTTAIAYVNAAPHIGHALEFIQADVLARYYRLRGHDTYFLTGTDEHGVKIYEAARAAAVEIQQFVDQNAQKYVSLCENLKLSNDYFVRTTSAKHKAGVIKIWNKMLQADDIYKGLYKGNYCVGCEAFIPDKDLDEQGNCPIHKKKPQILEEENYFFKLSRYSEQIKALIESDKLLILPESRKKEMLNIIGEEGLKDVSFSRPKSVLPWGITVPNDSSQVMYVWCDALSNYITALDYENDGELFRKFWPCDLHLIGKDILRFHAGIWIGMLLSAGVAIPKAIYVHGFVTSEGQKMSKSLGNVVDPIFYLEKYGVDALRYYLLKEIPTLDDGDFSHARFVDVYNSDLANSLGNLVNRVLTMVIRYSQGKVPTLTNGEGTSEKLSSTALSENFDPHVPDSTLRSKFSCRLVFDSFSEVPKAIAAKLEDIFSRYERAFAAFDLKAACECIVELADFGNKYIDEKKPWILAKEGSDSLSGILYDLLEILRFLALLLLPILPGPAMKIAESLGLGSKSANFDTNFGKLKKGAEVRICEALFPRIE